MRKLERKRMNSEQRKYFLVGSLCIAIFLMLGIGYAVLSQQLDINGTAQITSNWKILFTSAEEKEMNNATTTRKDISGLTTLILDVNLTQPGASATYDVIVENQGDLDAVLSSINGVSESNNKDPKAIKVSVENIKVGDPLLAGEDKTFQVKVYWDANVDFSDTDMQKEIEITLTYEQSDDGVPVGPIPSDGVDMGGQDVEIVTSGDGLYEDSTRLGRYVYKGANPDNYIQFNDELWRIVSREMDGTYKIVRNEILPDPMTFDEEEYRTNELGGTYCMGGYSGCNAWAANKNLQGTPEYFMNGSNGGEVLLDSSLNQYLNSEYLLYLNDSQYIVNHSWGVGGSHTSANLADDNLTWPELVEEENQFLWNGKIALLSMSDIYLATSNEELCGTVNQYSDNEDTCAANNYLLSIDERWWLLSPQAETYSSVYLVSYSTPEAALEPTTELSIRPALYLSSNIHFSGNGTQVSPYVIG